MLQLWGNQTSITTMLGFVLDQYVVYCKTLFIQLFVGCSSPSETKDHEYCHNFNFYVKIRITA